MLLRKVIAMIDNILGRDGQPTISRSELRSLRGQIDRISQLRRNFREDLDRLYAEVGLSVESAEREVERGRADPPGR